MLTFLRTKLIDWCLSKREKTIGELYTESLPEQVQIPDQNGNLKFIGSGTSPLLVQTPTGWSPIKKILKTIEYQAWELTLENGKSLKCADEHLVITEAGEEKHVYKLTPDDVIQTISGPSKVKTVAKLNFSDNMFDLELDDDDHVYYTNGILSHNTTVVAMYILWLTCFADDKLAVIASKAMNHATEIMSRIKFAYEELPAWLKPGCKYYSRTSIEFDNGSKIKSEATSEKTGRGGSPSFLFIDEIAFINRRIQEEMWASIAPSLSTGGKFVLTSTPNGDSDLFASIWRGANSGQNSFYPVRTYWHEHPERDQKYYDEMKGKLGPVQIRQEVDCEFLSSDALLVDTRKLHSLKTKPPLFENMGFKFWKEVSGANKMYLVGVDPATGTGSDFTAIEVFEFPSLEQVAELRLNTVNIPLIYAKIKWLLKHLRAQDANRNSAEVLWTFERNGIGEALVAMIQNDDGDGIDIDGVDLYNENNGKFGCFTSGSSKLLACMQLKNLIERISNGLVVNSEVLHFELQNYIATGGTYAAKKGSTDDTISATLLVIKLLKRLSEQDEVAQKLVYENVAADSDLDSSLDGDQFGGEPVPFGVL